ncbi:MAG: transposase [Ruminococcus sp.]|nr:transposase [Ruminococcus sp.]
MWIYLTGSDVLPPIILYDYAQRRIGKYARDFREGFMGLFQCDGYQGYNKVADVILVFCRAHCRRKFYEAIPEGRRKSLKLLDINSETRINDPVIPDEAEQEKIIPAEIGLCYCNKLFYIERTLKGLPADERKAKREELETPVWNGFWKWIDTIRPLGGSKPQKAVNYALNHHETLCNYMKDGRCEISNNTPEPEQKAMPLAVRHFYFTHPLLGQMLPWSDFMKEHCAGLIDVENITAEKHEPLPV